MPLTSLAEEKFDVRPSCARLQRERRRVHQAQQEGFSKRGMKPKAPLSQADLIGSRSR